MAVTANTATSLSESYYLRSFYKSNRDASVSSKRSLFSNSSLSQADSAALRAGIRKLRDFDLEDDTNDGANIYSGVSAFLETYNHALSSCGNSKDYSLKRYAKQLKKLAQDYSKELKEIGVTVNSDGSLTKNDTLLKASSVSEIKTLFGKDAAFSTQAARYAKRINNTAADLVYTELTQKGSTINLQA